VTVPIEEEERLQAARELVIRTRPTSEGGTVATTLALDNYVPLLAEIVECQNMVDFWEKRLKRLKEGLGALLGEAHNGTVNGEQAVAYEPVNRFNTTAFRRQYPNLWRAYVHTVSKEELDVEMLRLSRPDLYAEFQVRPLRVTYEPPGSVR
jgi:hypothetical protein